MLENLSQENVKNRRIIEAKLARLGVRVFRDIHVSGHAAREDQRDLIEMLSPKHIIPAHGEPEMTSALKDLTSELSYPDDKVHVVSNGDMINID
jgi:ribonuclease J